MALDFFVIETGNLNGKGEKIFYVGVGSNKENAVQISETFGKKRFKAVYKEKLSALVSQVNSL